MLVNELDRLGYLRAREAGITVAEDQDAGAIGACPDGSDEHGSEALIAQCTSRTERSGEHRSGAVARGDVRDESGQLRDVPVGEGAENIGALPVAGGQPQRLVALEPQPARLETGDVDGGRYGGPGQRVDRRRGGHPRGSLAQHLER